MSVQTVARRVVTQSSASQQESKPASDETTVHPFRVSVPEADLDDLRRRIAATRFPEKETVADQSQGTQLATSQALARYWASDYDWRKCEARLNSYPLFITEIDGLDIRSARTYRVVFRIEDRTVVVVWKIGNRGDVYD